MVMVTALFSRLSARSECTQHSTMNIAEMGKLSPSRGTPLPR